MFGPRAIGRQAIGSIGRHAARQVVAAPARDEAERRRAAIGPDAGGEEAVDHLLDRAVAADRDDAVMAEVGGRRGKPLGVAGLARLEQPRLDPLLLQPALDARARCRARGHCRRSG